MATSSPQTRRILATKPNDMLLLLQTPAVVSGEETKIRKFRVAKATEPSEQF